MRLPEKLPLYAKWVVVWLVLLPMILNRVEHSGAFASAWVCALVVGVGFGLCVPLVDEMFLFFCQPRKKQKSHAAYILTFSTCQHDFTHENEKLKRGDV